LRETNLEKTTISVKSAALTSPECGCNFNPPFEEARRPDGRPAERHWGATEKRISAQVVLSTSPRPGSATPGRITKGWLERETRSFEIDARRCKPQQAARLKGT